MKMNSKIACALISIVVGIVISASAVAAETSTLQDLTKETETLPGIVIYPKLIFTDFAN